MGIKIMPGAEYAAITNPMSLVEILNASLTEGKAGAMIGKPKREANVRNIMISVFLREVLENILTSIQLPMGRSIQK
tara:strand:+ start:585 stop:815 length:231 start_codon:yes stop_codon:yes gene_type:complete